MSTLEDEKIEETAWGEKTRQVVVLSDGIAYHDPRSDADKIAERAVTAARRGDTVWMGEREAKRHQGLGSVTDDLESLDARYARSGQQDPRRFQHYPPSATPMVGPTAEAVRAAQNAATTPGGTAGRNANELLKLDVSTLKTVAVAFGVVIREDDTKESLAERLAGPVDAEALSRMRGARDQIQLDARETGEGAGLPVAQVEDENREESQGPGAAPEDAPPERGTTAEGAVGSTARGNAGTRGRGSGK